MGSESQPWFKIDLSSKWPWPCPSAQGGFCWANPGAAPSAQPCHPPEFPLLMPVGDVSPKPVIVHSKLTWLSFGACHGLVNKWCLSHRNAHTLLKKERVALEPWWMQKVLLDIGEVVCFLWDWQFRLKASPFFSSPRKTHAFLWISSLINKLYVYMSIILVKGFEEQAVNPFSISSVGKAAPQRAVPHYNELQTWTSWTQTISAL